MGIVAGRAISTGHRTVVPGIFLEQFLHVGEKLAVVIGDLVLVMTAEALVHRQLGQQMLHVGAVRIVAVDAFATGGDGAVRHLGVDRLVLYFFVATEAAGADVVDQQLGQGRVVRVVAIGAARGGGGVAGLAGEDDLEVVVAIEAELVDRSVDRAGLVRVGILVAYGAIAALKRSMGGEHLLFRRQGRDIGHPGFGWNRVGGEKASCRQQQAGGSDGWRKK